jgi:hypothetical protein
MFGVLGVGRGVQERGRVDGCEGLGFWEVEGLEGWIVVIVWMRARVFCLGYVGFWRIGGG